MRLTKLLEKLRHQPHNTRFQDLVIAAEAVGFVYVRTTGAHQFYRHHKHTHLQLNLQPVRGRAKGYQVKDFLQKVERYNLDDE